MRVVIKVIGDLTGFKLRTSDNVWLKRWSSIVSLIGVTVICSMKVLRTRKTKGLPNGKPLFNLTEAHSAKLMSKNVRNISFLLLINNMLSKSIVRGRIATSEKKLTFYAVPYAWRVV